MTAAAMPWVQALDLQGELYRWWSGPQGHRFVESVARFTARKMGGLDDMMRSTAAIEAEKLRVADPYWVHPDMVRLTEHAARSMASETLEPTDLPTPTGFVLLGATPDTDPFGDRDDSELVRLNIPPVPGEIPMVAFSWGPGPLRGSGIHLLFYTPSNVLRPDDPTMAKVMVMNQHAWPFGQHAPSGEEEPVHRFCKAFWALCQQRIGRADQAEVDRAGKRRAVRAGLESLIGVRVVTIRRRVALSTDADSEPSGVDWSCRWVVEGHWRNQWYPSAELHRQIWIAPYEKGPEDAPLRLKDRVFKVTR